MTATGEDYAWFGEQLPGLAQGYCITLVSNVEPVGVLHRFGARAQMTLTGITAVVRAAYDAWEDPEPLQLIGALAVGSWTLAVEPNGYLGVQPAIAAALSREATVVSHYRNINFQDQFSWAENGLIKISFKPRGPWYRTGSATDDITDMLSASGFDITGPDAPQDTPGYAAFALAENITGVRLTAELFLSSTFVCGIAPLLSP